MSATDSHFVAPPHVAAIAPYQPGKPIEELAREFGLDPKQISQARFQRKPAGHASLCTQGHCRRNR